LRWVNVDDVLGWVGKFVGWIGMDPCPSLAQRCWRRLSVVP